jgi:hypothetical protein
MARPKLVQATAEDEVYDFDHYLEQAAQATKPFKLRLPVYETVKDEETGESKSVRTGSEVVEVPAPTTAAMKRVAIANRSQDIDELVDAAFGVYAERVSDLTDGEDNLIVNKMALDLLAHYGRRMEDLGES